MPITRYDIDMVEVAVGLLLLVMIAAAWQNRRSGMFLLVLGLLVGFGLMGGVIVFAVLHPPESTALVPSILKRALVYAVLAFLFIGGLLLSLRYAQSIRVSRNRP